MKNFKNKFMFDKNKFEEEKGIYGFSRETRERFLNESSQWVVTEVSETLSLYVRKDLIILGKFLEDGTHVIGGASAKRMGLSGLTCAHTMNPCGNFLEERVTKLETTNVTNNGFISPGASNFIQQNMPICDSAATVGSCVHSIFDLLPTLAAKVKGGDVLDSDLDEAASSVFDVPGTPFLYWLHPEELQLAREKGVDWFVLNNFMPSVKGRNFNKRIYLLPEPKII